MDLLNQLSNLAGTIISALIIPVIPLIAAFIIILLKKKINELESSQISRSLSKYTDIAENAIITAVTSVSQTYVDDIKKKNGSLTQVERKTAFEMSKAIANKIIGESNMEVLKAIYPDTNTWLENRIEYYVSQNKKLPLGTVRT